MISGSVVYLQSRLSLSMDLSLQPLRQSRSSRIQNASDDLINNQKKVPTIHWTVGTFFDYWSVLTKSFGGERGRWTWHSNLFKFNVLYLIFCLWGTDKCALQNGTLVLGLLPIVSTILGFKDTIYFAISNYAGLQSFNVSARCKLIYI